MSGDPEQDFFADGMAEDLITELSRMPWFYVIARNSSFTYKGRAVDIKQAGKDLGAAYVLEGSVRKAGNRLRITAQLIDTGSGAHVWADRYDRELADIFDVQDEITHAIIAAVTPEFISAEVRKTRRKDPSQLNAWECVMRGRAHIWKMSREDGLEARRLFQKAMELAPGSGLGAADLALVHLYEAFYGWSSDRQQSFKAMLATAQSAAEADENDPMALTILAVAQLFSRDFDGAMETIERALAISPQFAPAVGVRGSIFACTDELDLAVSTVKQAAAAEPSGWFHAVLVPDTMVGISRLARLRRSSGIGSTCMQNCAGQPVPTPAAGRVIAYARRSGGCGQRAEGVSSPHAWRDRI
jgi:TolB-like protein